MLITHPTLYVLQYGNVDMEEDTFSCLVEAENLEAAIQYEMDEFTKNAEECDLENFRVFSRERDDGEIIVYLEDNQKNLNEWQRFTKARIADYK